METKTKFGSILVSESNFISYVKRLTETKPRMTFGTGFHAILETPLEFADVDKFVYNHLHNDKTFTYFYEFQAVDLFSKQYDRRKIMFEVPELFEFDGTMISMRIDGLMADKILEFKTEYIAVTGDGINESKYIDSLQHQIYMLAMELYNADYLVWQFLARDFTEYKLNNLFTLTKSPVYQISFLLENFEIIKTTYNNNFENTLKYILKELNDFINVNRLNEFVEFKK
jgi:hypothetical protein